MSPKGSPRSEMMILMKIDMKSDKIVKNDCRKKWPSGRKPQTKLPRKIHVTGPPPRERFFTKNDENDDEVNDPT